MKSFSRILLFAGCCLRLQIWYPASPALAAPAQKKVTFDVPIGSAKTIQVTEKFYESAISDTGFGPFQQTDKVKLYLQPPALPAGNDWRYRLEWEGTQPPKTEGHYVVNGKKEAFYQGKKRTSSPSSPGQWDMVLT